MFKHSLTSHPRSYLKQRASRAAAIAPHRWARLAVTFCYPSMHHAKTELKPNTASPAYFLTSWQCTVHPDRSKGSSFCLPLSTDNFPPKAKPKPKPKPKIATLARISGHHQRQRPCTLYLSGTPYPYLQ